MQMAVNTLLYAILLHELQNLSAAVAGSNGRVVQETQNFLYALGLCCPERGFQPDELPPENFLIMAFLEVFLEKPATGPTNTNVIINETIIKEEINIFYLIFFKKLLHLPDGTPPEVMIALSDDLFARQIG